MKEKKSIMRFVGVVLLFVLVISLGFLLYKEVDWRSIQGHAAGAGAEPAEPAAHPLEGGGSGGGGSCDEACKAAIARAEAARERAERELAEARGENLLKPEERQRVRFVLNSSSGEISDYSKDELSDEQLQKACCRLKAQGAKIDASCDCLEDETPELRLAIRAAFKLMDERGSGSGSDSRGRRAVAEADSGGGSEPASGGGGSARRSGSDRDLSAESRQLDRELEDDDDIRSRPSDRRRAEADDEDEEDDDSRDTARRSDRRGGYRFSSTSNVYLPESADDGILDENEKDDEDGFSRTRRIIW